MFFFQEYLTANARVNCIISYYHNLLITGNKFQLINNSCLSFVQCSVVLRATSCELNLRTLHCLFDQSHGTLTCSMACISMRLITLFFLHDQAKCLEVNFWACSGMGFTILVKRSPLESIRPHLFSISFLTQLSGYCKTTVQSPSYVRSWMTSL